ncbi:MAG: DMT family transporter [Firmicutes bacterium]|nr:DMT family transporter [Bacillota bacterium]
MKRPSRTIVLGIFCAVANEVLYGFSYLFTKQITNQVSAITLLSWRFLIAFLTLSLARAFGLIKVLYKGKKPGILFAVAFLQPVCYFICEALGVSMTTASESGTIIASIPVVTLAASSLILKERPTHFQMIGIGVSLSGVVLTSLLQGGGASFNLPGYIILFFAVISYSLYAVLVQKARQYTSMELTYGMIAVGAGAYGVMALTEHLLQGTVRQWILLPFTNPDFLAAALYLGIGSSVFAFFLANAAFASLGANRTAAFVGISTVVSILLGVVVLHERFTGWQAFGAALILAGVYIANLGGNRKVFR